MDSPAVGFRLLIPQLHKSYNLVIIEMTGTSPAHVHCHLVNALSTKEARRKEMRQLVMQNGLASEFLRRKASINTDRIFIRNTKYYLVILNNLVIDQLHQ